MITFGPVPSRRLSQSLGINNIPPKFCPYSCVYCQVGITAASTVDRREFYPPDDIASAVIKRVRDIQRREEPLDFLSFVPDGEPTLDIHLGSEVEKLRSLGIRIAVVSNASLLWRQEVRESLRAADWVSLKVDAVREGQWRRINRPHPSLRIENVLRGMLDFSANFEGELTTQTMLISGLNDDEESIAETARFLAQLGPSTAYLGIPTRPTVESWAKPPSEGFVTRAYQILSKRLSRVELLTSDEGAGFGTTGDVEADLISITSVHPLRADAIRALLGRNGADWSVVEGLINRGALAEIEYRGRKFYVRRFSEVGKANADRD